MEEFYTFMTQRTLNIGGIPDSPKFETKQPSLAPALGIDGYYLLLRTSCSPSLRPTRSIQLFTIAGKKSLHQFPGDYF